MSLTEQLKRVPGFPRLWSHLRALFRPFRGPLDYWEERYARGGTSGGGSYGEEAEYKARMLNAFVKLHDVRSVIELGCGDGNQLSLANYPSYVGVDIAPSAVDRCRQRFAGDDTTRFYTLAEFRATDVGTPGSFDLSLSLDVVYHLVEDRLFREHMDQMFALAGRFVIIYSSNEDLDGGAPHVQHRRFTAWVAAHYPSWRLMDWRSHLPENASPRKRFVDFYVYERPEG